MGGRRWGALIATCAGMLLGAPAAAHAGDPFYGVFSTDLSLPAASQSASLDAQAATGAGALREHIYWDRIERAPGSFDFTQLDALVGQAAARGLTVLPVITSTPAFYSTRPAGRTDDGWPPKDPSSILRFALALTQRYGAAGSFWGCLVPGVRCSRPFLPIHAWEVWNEPDYPSWWRTGPDPQAYTSLLAYASIGLRAGDPTAEVVLGGLSTHALGSGGYLDQLLADNAGLWFSTLALHPYASTVGGVVSEVQQAEATAAAHGLTSVPMRITEYGFADGGTSAFAVPTACQAALDAAVTSTLSASRSALRITGVDLFQWTDHVPDARNLWPDHAGLLRVDGTAKPALAAFTDAIAGRPAAQTVAQACPPANQG